MPRPVPTGINAAQLSRRIDQFLGSRGYEGEPRNDAPDPIVDKSRDKAPGQPAAPAAEAVANEAPLTFVCEEDVRLAIRSGRKLLVAERAIVTPSARDLAEAHHVLTVAS